MSKDQVITLLDRYLKGDCTEEEKQRVLSWLEEINNGSNEWVALSDESKRNYIERLYSDLQSKIGVASRPNKNDNRRFLFRAVAAVLVLVAAAGLLYVMLPQPEAAHPTKYSNIFTGIGKKSKVTLPDGTDVWLNAMSELRYPSGFHGDKREVYLKGEAFFNVAKDQNKPFIVHSGVLQTKVLGTSFDIGAYPKSKDIDITVLSGKVAVNRKGHNNIVILEKNEKVSYKKESAVWRKEKVVNIADVLAWRNNQLAFYHTPMTEVAKAFYRAFGIKMRFANKTVRQYKLSGHFDTKQMPDKVLKAICLSIGSKYEYIKERKEVIIDVMK